jgi:Clp amino terminal domain, pathogenicity island component
MIRPDLADLVLMAGVTLGLRTGATLDLLDVAAAEAALAEANSCNDRSDPGGSDPAQGGAAECAAALLHALVRHRPFRRGNEQIAVVAAVQFLSLNGWRADLDPPEMARSAVAGLAAGTLTTADFAAWLSPRLSPCPRAGLSPGGEPITEEAPMRGWLPGRRRTARRRPASAAPGRLTDRARQVIVLAQEEARGLRHSYVGTEHILLGLLREGDGVAAHALGSLGVTAEAVRQQVEEIIGRGKGAPPRGIPMTPRAKKILEISLREAMRLDHLYIGTEHILLGMLREGEGLAVTILAKLGAHGDQIRHTVAGLLAEHEHPRPEPGSAGGAASPGGRALQPPGLRGYDEKIAVAAHQKDAAIDARDFDLAAGFRDTEKRLLAERAQRITEWSAGVDVAAMGEELDRLHREVARLQGLLLQHGIQPGDGTQQTA